MLRAFAWIQLRQEVAMSAPPAVLDKPHEVPSEAPVLTTAEVAECTCPDFCERDHERD